MAKTTKKKVSAPVETCSTDSACLKKFVITAVAAFALTMGFDWYVHGVLLMDQYTATASLWRPQAEMEAMSGLCIAKHAIQALVFTVLFMCWKKYQTFGACFTSLCPVRKGFYFGGLIGLMLGLNAAASYIWMPIPQSLAIAWGVAEVVKWGLVAGVLAFLCHRCSNKA